MEQNLVVKTNILNESRYKLTVQEQRVILTMISMIKPTDKSFKPYSFTVKEFADLVGIKGKNLYGRIKEITKTLVNRTLTIKEPDGDLHVGWVSSAKYFDGQGMVELRFDPLLKPYLLALKQEFTRYQLKNTIRLKSAYSVRIYELLKQYQSVGSRYFKIDELRTILGVPDGKLNTYSNFKLRVIEPAQVELQHTDISFTYKPGKTGRKVTGLTFNVFKNKDVVNKSYKKKKSKKEIQLELNLREKEVQKEQTVQEILHQQLAFLEVLYPEYYEKLKKAARTRFSKKELTQRGHGLKVVFKMKSMLPKFIQKYKINL